MSHQSGDWRNSSACSSNDTTIFFPTDRHAKAAREICGTCTVTVECRQFADDNLIPHGVFGGENGTDRRARLQIDKVGRPLSFSLGLYPEGEI
jgi:hypothetical protein